MTVLGSGLGNTKIITIKGHSLPSLFPINSRTRSHIVDSSISSRLWLGQTLWDRKIRSHQWSSAVMKWPSYPCLEPYLQSSLYSWPGFALLPLIHLPLYILLSCILKSQARMPKLLDILSGSSGLTLGLSGLPSLCNRIEMNMETSPSCGASLSSRGPSVAHVVVKSPEGTYRHRV